MKKVLGLAVVGLLSSVSFAHADTTTNAPVPGPTLTPVYGISYSCEFEGRAVGHDSGSDRNIGHQDRDVRCRAEGTLPLVGASNEVDVSSIPGGPVEIKCSNGYRLKDEYPALAEQGGTLWINAEKHDKLATIRIRDFFAPNAQNYEKRFKADLIATNSSMISAEGHCRFEYPSPPVAPPVPLLSE